MTKEQLHTCPQCTKSDVIDQTAQDVTEMKSDMTLVKNSILGDKFHPIGIIAKQAKDHVRISRLERVVYMGSVAVGLVAFLVKIIF